MTPLNFKLWRVARGLNQAACGQLFGVSQAAVSWWELHGVPKWVETEVGRITAEGLVRPEVQWAEGIEGETEGQWADRMFGPDSGCIE